MNKEFFKELVAHNSLSAPLDESTLFNEKELTTLDVLGMNIAFSGDVEGGMGSGLHFFAAPSKHFKTIFGLLAVSSYLKKHPDGFAIFYDSEFGSTLAYWKAAGIDMSRVIHVPIRNVEEFKFDIVGKLEMITAKNAKAKSKQKIMILVDSVGNLASKKEVQDAIDEKSVADMSRAKALKGLFRIITPYFSLEDIPCIAINHVYSEMGMFPKTIMGGGTGGTYSATNIFFISKAQEKGKEDGDKKEKLTGFTFKIKVEKSRYVKEQSIIPITVGFKGGVNKYTGLWDIALETGDLVKVTNSMYTRNLHNADGEVIDDKNWYKKDVNAAWWEEFLANSSLKANIRDKFRLGQAELLAKESEPAYSDEDDEE